jgi:hypothetical protein
VNTKRAKVRRGMTSSLTLTSRRRISAFVGTKTPAQCFLQFHSVATAAKNAKKEKLREQKREREVASPAKEEDTDEEKETPKRHSMSVFSHVYSIRKRQQEEKEKESSKKKSSQKISPKSLGKKVGEADRVEMISYFPFLLQKRRLQF